MPNSRVNGIRGRQELRKGQREGSLCTKDDQKWGIGWNITQFGVLKHSLEKGYQVRQQAAFEALAILESHKHVLALQTLDVRLQCFKVVI